MLNKPNKKPTSSVIEKAMEFMSAFGRDDAKLKALLEEMKEVQIHNEKVLAESSASMIELDKRRDEVNEGQKQLALGIASWHDRRQAAEDRFEKIKNEFESNFEEEKVEHDQEVRDLTLVKQEVNTAITQVEQRQDSLSLREGNLNEKTHRLDIATQECNAKRAKIESLINQFKQI